MKKRENARSALNFIKKREKKRDILEKREKELTDLKNNTIFNTNKLQTKRTRR